MSGHPQLLRVRLATACALLALVLVGTVAPAANAGTYDVVSCQTPSGSPTSTAGWTGWSQLLYDRPSGSCKAGSRGLTAKFSAREGGVAGGLASGWTFRAPADTEIVAVRASGRTVTRAAEDRGGAYPSAGIGMPAASAEAASGTTPTTPPASGATTVDGKLSGVTGREFSVYAGCSGPGDGICSRGAGSRATATLRSARITLEDGSTPQGTASGRAITGNYVRGTSSLHLKASDTGSGIWQAEIRIGSKVVLPRTTLDGNGGRCVQLPGSTAFGSPTPCPRKVSRTLRFNTKRAREGSQMLTVTVWDAANNPKIVAFQPVLVDNDKQVQPDGTILMPAPDSAVLTPLSATGGFAPPLGAGDPAIQPLVSAMNTLADMQLPYCYGGGHGVTPAVPGPGSYCWVGNPAQKLTGDGTVGFDCSSSVSWVLQQAGFDLETMTSSSFMNWGDEGPGQFVTIWTNPSHVYLEIQAGDETYYWGTAAANPQHGPGWHAPRSPSAFVARHPPGL